MPTKDEALAALNSVAANHEGTFAAARAFGTLRQYIESTARDAERYAFLRSIDHEGCSIFEFGDAGNPDPHKILIGGHADDFIDAAIAQKDKP